MNVTAFRKELFTCLNNIKDGSPLTITNKHDTYVIMNESDYKSLQETIYLMTDPVTRKSILTPSEDETWYGEEDLAWNRGH